MSIEVSKFSEANHFWGYVVLLLVTTLKFQFFVTIFAHSVIAINEVHLELSSPSCGHGANRTGLCAGK